MKPLITAKYFNSPVLLTNSQESYKVLESSKYDKISDSFSLRNESISDWIDWIELSCSFNVFWIKSLASIGFWGNSSGIVKLSDSNNLRTLSTLAESDFWTATRIRLFSEESGELENIALSKLRSISGISLVLQILRLTLNKLNLVSLSRSIE